MRSILLAAVMLSIMGVGAISHGGTLSPAGAPFEMVRAPQSDTLIFTVYGMDCPGCEDGLEKQVNKIPYVRFSKASWVKQELKIVMENDSILHRDELEMRVEKANFTLEKEAKTEQ